jgi:hypothetical protein
MKLPVAFGSSAKLEPVLPWKLSVAPQLLVGERVDSNADRLTTRIYASWVSLKFAMM